MRLKAFTRIGSKEVIDADVVVVIVEDDSGNPISVTCETQPGVIVTSHIEEGDDFQKVLYALGMDKIVICEKLPKITPPHGTIIM